MTDKLYEEDAYLREFEAEVTGCVPAEGGWLVTLDRTAFYPEGGGQPPTREPSAARGCSTYMKRRAKSSTRPTRPSGGRSDGGRD